MSTAAPETLDRGALPWLFAAALATTLPHFLHQPAWLSATTVLIFAWGGWLWWRGTRLPNRWLLVFIVAVVTGGILLQFRTILGREAGVGMLVLFMALKLLELKRRRDAYVAIVLGYFLLLTHYFESQSIGTGAWLLVSAIALTAALVRLHGGPPSGPVPTLRTAAVIALQAAPLMLVLYVLFPRVSGPLWGLPQDAQSARTGLTDTMSPGSFSSLAQSAEIAFRVRFSDGAPPKDKLYWRGPVMEDYDGITWRQLPSWGSAPVVEPVGQPVRYTLTLEAHQQRWLLALDAPTALPPETRLSPSMVVFSTRPVTQRRRLELAANPDYRFNLSESRAALQRNLRLPPNANPRTRGLAEEWRRADPDPARIVQRALAHFRSNPFVYTLQPPLLGQDAMDDFLFRTQRGFCEHYASAFVVLMRAAGVPARVVGGYQGGETNPFDEHLIVRQSDAHAWAEVWLAGRGWMRVDPTAAISPARIESGIASAVPTTDPLPAFARIDASWVRQARLRWEAVNNLWNQWVLGYNPERQREFLSRLGLPRVDWQTLGLLLTGICALLMLVISAWILYRRPRVDPALRLWKRALRRARRRGLSHAEWEAPMALARRLQREDVTFGTAMVGVAERYCAARYGSGPTDLDALRRAVAALP